MQGTNMLPSACQLRVTKRKEGLLGKPFLAP